MDDTYVDLDDLWEQIDETTTAYVGLPSSTIVAGLVLLYVLSWIVGPVFARSYFDITLLLDAEPEPANDEKKPPPPADKKAAVSESLSAEPKLAPVLAHDQAPPLAEPEPEPEPEPLTEQAQPVGQQPPPLVGTPSPPPLEQKQPPPVPIATALIELTEEELLAYNGSNLPSSEIYLAIEGVIYDVSKSEHLYKPGKPYAMFAGKEVSRALAKMSLHARDLTGNISDLSPSEKRELRHWKVKFDEKYPKVGSVKKY